MDFLQLEQYVQTLMQKTKPLQPFWNVEQIRQGKSPKWNYVDGCMLTALLSLGEITGNREYFTFVQAFIDDYIGEDGSLLGYRQEEFCLDDIAEGRALFTLYRETGKEKYKRAIDTLYAQIRSQPRTPSGNFWHKKIYPEQVWLDGLYMAMPFYACYQKAFGGGNFEDIVKQFESAHAAMFCPEKGLYFHGWDSSKRAFWADKRTGLSQSFWLRAIGWYLMGLVDVIEILPPKTRWQNRLVAIFQLATEGIERYIDGKTQMLYQVVDCAQMQGNYLETSGSAMVSYAMLKGARLGVVDKRFSSVGLGIFWGICNEYLQNTEGDFALGGICLSAGLGPEDNPARNGTFAYYVSEPVVAGDAKGTAPLITAYTEVKRL